MQTSTIKAMSSLKRILVATDLSVQSAAAFQTALDVCLELGASLSILHVLDQSHANPQAADQRTQQKSRADGALRCLDELQERATNVGVTSTTLLEKGVVPLRILDTIASKHIDLAILGTKAIHGIKRLASGSTAEEVLRNAPCPVLVVGPRVPDVAVKMEGPVVFATDFGATTIDAILLAALFSRSTGSSLRCLRVLPRTAEGTERSRIIPQTMNETLQRIAAETGRNIVPPICATSYGDDIPAAIAD